MSEARLSAEIECLITGRKLGSVAESMTRTPNLSGKSGEVQLVKYVEQYGTTF